MVLQGSPTGQAAWPGKIWFADLALAKSIGSLISQWIRLHILLRPMAQLTSLVLGGLRMGGPDGFDRSNN